jgi:hypothetical protein
VDRACLWAKRTDAARVERVVKPEILDDLPMDDPSARASRADLRRINFLMGNERWILKQ